MAEGPPGAAVGMTAAGIFGSGVGPGGGATVGSSVGGGAFVGGGGAFWVRSATTVWAAWVWIRAVSWVGGGVAAGPQALNTRAPMITRLNISTFLFVFGFFFICLFF